MDERKAPWLIEDDLDSDTDRDTDNRQEAAPVDSPSAGTVPLLSHLRCPACSGTGEEASAVEASGWSRCAGCGTHFRRERPSLGQLAKMRNGLFAGCFGRPLHAEKRGGRDQAMRAMKGYFETIRGRPVALNAFGRSVLDVGCGVGFRMRVFQDYGWAAVGTETSADAHEYTRRQTLDVKNAWLRDAGFGRTRFDLALFCGSVGELPDTVPALDHLHDALKPDGLVCVLDEPLCLPEAIPEPGDLRVALFTADGLRKVFCDNRYSFLRQEVQSGCGTFWFQAKSRR